MRILPSLALLLVLVAGCADTGGPLGSNVETSGSVPATPSGTSPAAGSVRLAPLLSGLDDPVFVTHAGDGSGRLFIVEQSGKIRISKDGELLPTPFLDVASRIVSGGERGLLGMTFHPDFET